jgi:hypothetical protein
MSSTYNFKTTAKHFACFEQEATYWIRKYGLLQYEWQFEHASSDNRAGVVFNVDAKIAMVTLSTDWDVEPTARGIRRAAYHEVYEVLLGYMKVLAISRTFDEALLECETHTVIRTMENAHFEEDYDRRFVRQKKRP